MTTSLDKRWCLQVAISFGRKTRRLSNDAVPRGESDPRGGSEETVTGTGTRVGIGAGTRAKRRVEERESPGTHEVIVGRRERGGDAKC